MKPYILAFLAGLVSACGFQPWGIWPAALLSLAFLLWLVIGAADLKGALARGWWFGAGQFVLGLNWIATSFTYQANMPAWLGWIAVVLLSLYLAIYPAMAAGLAWKYGRRDRLSLALIFAAAWIVTEWLRATMFTGFAWNPLGVLLLDTPASRLATWFGSYGLSGVAILVAGTLYLMAEREWRNGAMLAFPLAALTALAVLASPAGNGAAGPTLRIVQPNIGQQDKWKPGFEESNFQRLARLSGPPSSTPRLLLWPEAAVTRPLEDQRTDFLYKARAEQMRQKVGALLGPGDLLLTGGVTVRSANGLNATSATNSVFAIAGGGRILARYDKAHLVPYGEYLPARPLLSAFGLSRLAPGDVDFDAGPGPRTLALPVVGKVGFQLCYEIIFSGAVVERGKRPEFLFNPSNDAWFGAWGPPQHLAQARLRALEEGLPVLRSTPTGISAVIDGEGRVLRSLAGGVAGAIETTLPAPRPPTLFARAGNILSLLFALALAGLAIAVRRKAG